MFKNVLLKFEYGCRILMKRSLFVSTHFPKFYVLLTVHPGMTVGK